MNPKQDTKGKKKKKRYSGYEKYHHFSLDLLKYLQFIHVL